MLTELICGVREFLVAQRRTQMILQRMERTMSDAASQIDALSTKVDAIAADVAILVAGDTTGLDPELQAAIDRLSGKVDGLQGEVGDRDGSDAPAEPAPGDEDTQNL